MFIRRLLESITQLPVEFLDVALQDPFTAVLFAMGALLTLFASGVFGLLVLGALADLLSPSTGGEPPRPDR